MFFNFQSPATPAKRLKVDVDSGDVSVDGSVDSDDVSVGSGNVSVDSGDVSVTVEVKILLRECS